MKAGTGLMGCTSLAAMLALPAAALATPVTYDYTDGYVVITGATLAGSNVIASGQPALQLALGSASQVTFDTGSTPAELDSFDLAAPGSLSVNLTGALSGGGNLNSASFVLSNVTATLAAPVSVTSTGGSYQFEGASVDISGTYALNHYVNASNVTKSIGPINFGPNAQPLGGFIDDGNTLEMDAVSLGTFTIQGQTFSVDGNVIFDGVPAPVPLPASVWLFASGFCLLGGPFVRRNRAA
ncbi:MAG: hypothetical protein ABSH33_14360 [Steroidobacteraceae bacterium]